RPPNKPRASPCPALRPWSAITSLPSCGTPTGSSPARAVPPRSSASTPVRCGAGSRNSVFRAIPPNSEGLLATCRNAHGRPRLTPPPGRQPLVLCNPLHISYYGQRIAPILSTGTRFAFLCTRGYEEVAGVLTITLLSPKERELTIEFEGELVGAWA